MSAGDGRFDRQERFEPLGAQGQRRIEAARVLLVGCGALGGSLAQTLVRCGVGALVLADRDVVELSNLPRQVLFEERQLGRPKAAAAAESLARIGGPTRVDARAVHVDADNLEELAEGCDLLLDGTDNLATRYLLNDLAVRDGLPWIYGGVVGASGLVLAVWPGRGPCLRCVFPEPPPPGTLATCDTAGVILPAVSAVVAWQAGAALRWLASDEQRRARIPAPLVELDPWAPRARALELERDPACPCCGARAFPFLEAPPARSALALCGRNTVQVRPALPRGAAPIDLAGLAERLRGRADSVRAEEGLLRLELGEHRLTVFPDGRALIEGTEDLDRARAIYDRLVGS